MRRLLPLAFCLLLLTLPTASAQALTFEVTTTADSNSGTCTPGACTLRQAVGAANGSSGLDVVSLPTGTYPLTFGQLTSTDDLTISGAGADSVAIVSNGTSRVIANATPTVSLKIEGVTISGGVVKGTSASQARGGGIFNAGTLRLDRAVISGNKVEPADASGTSPRGGGVYSSGTALITNSKIEGNLSTARPFNGGIPNGGGVFNDDGTLEISDSRLLSNEVQTAAGGIPEGGGLASDGTSPRSASTTLTRSVLQANVAVGLEGTIPSGGAISTFDSDLTIRETTILGNKAISGAGGIAQGGGLYVSYGGTLLLADSLVAGNLVESPTIGEGGGVLAIAEANDEQSIVNSTIAGNQVIAAGAGIAEGGGLAHFTNTKAELEVVNATIAGNSVASTSGTATGGNVYDPSNKGGATVLRNSIVAAGSASKGPNCAGAAVKSAGHNIDSGTECVFTEPGDKTGVDPRLDPLADNGGPTKTMALQGGSPAIDAAGEPCPATDQRGIPRPQGPACDIGAYEVFVPPPTSSTPPTSSAKLRLLTKRVKISPKTGKGKLRVQCLNVPEDLCSVCLRLWWKPVKTAKASASKSRRIKIGTVTDTVAGGKSGPLRVKLNKRGRALLAASPKGKLSASALGTSKNRAAEPTQVKAKLLLKLKAKRSR